MAVVTDRIVLRLDVQGMDEGTRKMLQAAAAQTALEGGATKTAMATGKLNNALTNMSFAAAGIPGPIGRVAGALGGLMNPMTLAVGAIGLIVAGFIEAKKEAEEFAKALDNLRQRRLDLGLEDRSAELDRVRKELAGVRATLKEVQTGSITVAGTETFAIDPKTGERIQPVEDKQLLFNLQKQETDLVEKEARLVSQIKRDTKEIVQAIQEVVGGGPNASSVGFLTGLGLSVQAPGPRDRLGRKFLPGVRGRGFDRTGLDQSDQDILETFNREQPVINAGIAALGETLSSSLGGAFEDVFGEANSLLEQFAKRLTEILGEQLILGILSLATGLPFGGIPLGGQGAGGALPSERAISKSGLPVTLGRIQNQRFRRGLS